jgi:hypothetical protein
MWTVQQKAQFVLYAELKSVVAVQRRRKTSNRQGFELVDE